MVFCYVCCCGIVNVRCIVVAAVWFAMLWLVVDDCFLWLDGCCFAVMICVGCFAGCWVLLCLFVAWWLRLRCGCNFGFCCSLCVVLIVAAGCLRLFVSFLWFG